MTAPGMRAGRLVATAGRLAEGRFWFLLLAVLLLWTTYRLVFQFPVWFDEIVSKAVFFGLPVALYIRMSRDTRMTQTFSGGRVGKGLLLGAAVGGVFGFAAAVTSFVVRGVTVQAAPLFASNLFWWQFFLALMTGFWESLFFFAWVQTVVQHQGRRWGELAQVVVVALVFVVFHMPNAFLRAPSLPIAINQVLLLGIFAIGQALFFSRTKNLYALAFFQAIWGMVLLVHTV